MCVEIDKPLLILYFHQSLFQVLLAPSPKYTGLRDEAPRFMGDGFVVASSNQVDIYYYQDEPGRVPAAVTGAGDDGEHVSDSGSDRQTTASGSSCKSEAGKMGLMFLPHQTYCMFLMENRFSLPRCTFKNWQGPPFSPAAATTRMGSRHQVRERDKLQLWPLGRPSERTPLQVLFSSGLSRH